VTKWLGNTHVLSYNYNNPPIHSTIFPKNETRKIWLLLKYDIIIIVIIIIESGSTALYYRNAPLRKVRQGGKTTQRKK